jgi:hypothetical protein
MASDMPGTPLVQQHDDGLDALGLQLGGVPVGGLDLVGEVEPRDALLGDDVGGALEGHADEPDLDAVHLVDGVGVEQWVAALGPEGVGRQVLEVRALVGGAVGAAVVRVAAAVLDAQQFVGALVELVVADAGVVQPGQAERLDGGLVVERGRQQR